MSLYFAYGSNLSLRQMKCRCPESVRVCVGSLSGYRLGFTHYSKKWVGGVADIIPDLECEVWGLIYQLSEKDIESLDDYEGHNYKQLLVTIETSSGSIPNVLTYEVVNKKSFIPPSEAYLDIIKKAAKEFQFPEEYCVYLDSIKTK